MSKILRSATAANLPIPGPRALECLQLARDAVYAVRNDPLIQSTYKHGPGTFQVGLGMERQWKLMVDCSSFVRHVLWHVTRMPQVMVLSDKPYMRAKDYYNFFDSLPTDKTQNQSSWCRVLDLRNVMAGDVVAYCTPGRDAGNVAFVKGLNLQDTLRRVLIAWTYHMSQRRKHTDDDGVREEQHVSVSTQQLYQWTNSIFGELERLRVLHNGKPSDGDKLLLAVQEWFQSNPMTVLKEQIVKELPPGAILRQDMILELLNDAVFATAINTGHVVFCNGPAEHHHENEWRIPVVHSTIGPYRSGVQEGYKRFQRNDVVKNNEKIDSFQDGVAVEHWYREGSDDDDEQRTFVRIGRFCS